MTRSFFLYARERVSSIAVALQKSNTASLMKASQCIPSIPDRIARFTSASALLRNGLFPHVTQQPVNGGGADLVPSLVNVFRKCQVAMPCHRVDQRWNKCLWPFAADPVASLHSFISAARISSS